MSYYNINCLKIIFSIKLCKICYKKTNSKSKRLLVSIISIMLFKLISIDFIKIKLIPDITIIVIYKLIFYYIYYISKIHMFFNLSNKKVVIVAIVVDW